jgi:hypothetical protein
VGNSRVCRFSRHKFNQKRPQLSGRPPWESYANAYRVAVAVRGKEATIYPAFELNNQLRTVAAIIKAGFGPQVYCTSQPDYDTRSAVAPGHVELVGHSACRCSQSRRFPCAPN